MFFRDVLVKVLPVMAIGVIAPALVSYGMDAGWLRLTLVCIVSTLYCCYCCISIRTMGTVNENLL